MSSAAVVPPPSSASVLRRVPRLTTRARALLTAMNLHFAARGRAAGASTCISRCTWSSSCRASAPTMRTPSPSRAPRPAPPKSPPSRCVASTSSSSTPQRTADAFYAPTPALRLLPGRRRTRRPHPRKARPPHPRPVHADPRPYRRRLELNEVRMDASSLRRLPSARSAHQRRGTRRRCSSSSTASPHRASRPARSTSASASPPTSASPSSLSRHGTACLHPPPKRPPSTGGDQ